MAYPPEHPTVLFVTDPLCSWCWGMLPQMNQARDALADVARFDLLLAGLQISGTAGLSEFEGARLRHLWQKVATGQTFAGRLSEDPAFLYHSELACRAVEAVRQPAPGAISKLSSAPSTLMPAILAASKFWVNLPKRPACLPSSSRQSAQGSSEKQPTRVSNLPAHSVHMPCPLSCSTPVTAPNLYVEDSQPPIT